ncbi:MAG: hypothetical protein AAB638_03330 [Patescibacteria group bacterium]
MSSRVVGFGIILLIVSVLVYGHFVGEKRSGESTTESFIGWLSKIASSPTMVGSNKSPQLGPKVPTPPPAKPVVIEDDCPPKAFGEEVYFFPCVGDEFGERLAKFLKDGRSQGTYTITSTAPGISGKLEFRRVDAYYGYHVTFSRR